MIQRKTILVLLACAAVAAGGAALADNHGGDQAAIEQAVTDYVRSLYDMKPELLDGSVSTKVQKVGYTPKEDGSGWNESWMTHQELKDLAATLNKDGMFDPATSPLEVEILDHADMIATVKLTAAWGIDYIHLVKTDDGWMIMNVVWQMAAH